MHKIPVLVDFDNTFYQAGCDVDDGMALLYLLACPEIEVVGITSTYGNHALELVHENTLRLIGDFDLSHIPYARGCSAPGQTDSDACHLIIDLCHQYAHQLRILGLGALTNFWGAHQLDPTCLSQAQQIVLMGGLHQPLMFAKKQMAELNFSCDPKATYTLLTQATSVNIMTGNHCLDLLFTQAEYHHYFIDIHNTKQQLIQHYTAPWFVDNEAIYGIPGFYNWDSLAAAYLAHPEFFEDEWHYYQLDLSELAHGFLHIADNDSVHNAYLNTPRIKATHQSALRQHLYHAWLSHH